MFNKNNTYIYQHNNYNWSKLDNDIISKIFDYVNIDCNVCKRKIKNINILLLKHNNFNNFNNYNNPNKKIIYCSKECYNFV